MNGKQLLKAIETYRRAIERAGEEGESCPVIEAVIPVDAQRRIRRLHGDVVGDLVESVNDSVEELNEAQDDFDAQLDLLEYIARGLANADQLEQTLQRVTTPVDAGVPGADTPGDGLLNPDRAGGPPGSGGGEA